MGDCEGGGGGGGGGITDTFTRDQEGWGTCDAGLTYNTAGQGSVDGTRGILAAVVGSTSNSIYANLGPPAYSDVTVTAQVTLDAASPNVYRGVAFGGDVSTDGVYVSFSTDRTFGLGTWNDWAQETVSGVDPTQPFKMRFQIAGGNVQAKIWQASDPEPGTWNLTLTIAITVLDNGFYLANNAGYPFTDNLTIAFDNLDIVGVVGVSFVDTYTRTENGTWGTSDSGIAYTGISQGNRVVLVDGTQGYIGLIEETYLSVNGQQTVRQILDTLVPFPVEISVLVRFAPGDAELSFIFGTQPYAIITVGIDPLTGTVSLNGWFDYQEFTGFNFSNPYMMRIYADSTVLMKFKLWRPSDPEPAGWSGTFTDGAIESTETHPFDVQLLQYRQYGDTYGATGVFFDNLNVVGMEPGGDTCPECEDPNNPGQQIPPFTPGYLPTFRRQIGDPTTSLDSYICTFESGAMVLDWHTRGAIKVWGGELIPWCGRSEASIVGHGGNLDNIRQAWLHWGQVLDVRSGQHWDDLIACLNEGRAVILQGDYGEFTLAERCQDSFDGGHAISVYPYAIAGRLLVGDPLCHGFKNYKETSLRAYAEAMGASVYGAHSPQPILFAVSRPWVP
jgi:hypothetical protein